MLRTPTGSGRHTCGASKPPRTGDGGRPFPRGSPRPAAACTAATKARPNTSSPSSASPQPSSASADSPSEASGRPSPFLLGQAEAARAADRKPDGCSLLALRAVKGRRSRGRNGGRRTGRPSPTAPSEHLENPHPPIMLPDGHHNRAKHATRNGVQTARPDLRPPSSVRGLSRLLKDDRYTAASEQPNDVLENISSRLAARAAARSSCRSAGSGRKSRIFCSSSVTRRVSVSTSTGRRGRRLPGPPAPGPQSGAVRAGRCARTGGCCGR